MCCCFTSLNVQDIIGRKAEFLSLHLIVFWRVTTVMRPNVKSCISHLNARQRLVGPNGISSNHIDPVIVDRNSGLVLTWGGQSRQVVSLCQAEGIQTIWLPCPPRGREGDKWRKMGQGRVCTESQDWAAALFAVTLSSTFTDIIGGDGPGTKEESHTGAEKEGGVVKSPEP